MEDRNKISPEALMVVIDSISSTLNFICKNFIIMYASQKNKHEVEAYC